MPTAAAARDASGLRDAEGPRDASGPRHSERSFTGADPLELWEALEALREWQARSGTECQRPSCPCEDDTRGPLCDDEDEDDEEGGLAWQNDMETQLGSRSCDRKKREGGGEGETFAADGDWQQHGGKPRPLPSLRLRGLIDLDEFMSAFAAPAEAEGEAGGTLEPQASSCPISGEWDPSTHTNTGSQAEPEGPQSPGLCRRNTRASHISSEEGEQGEDKEEEGGRQGVACEDSKVMWSQFLSWRDLESSCALLDEAAKGAGACCPGQSLEAEEGGEEAWREGGKGWGAERNRMRILSMDLTACRQEPDGTEWCSPVVEIGRSSTPRTVMALERGILPWH